MGWLVFYRRVATAFGGCTALVLKYHTRVEDRGDENSPYLGRWKVPFDLSSLFIRIIAIIFPSYRPY
ncbi:hypothetical protein YJ57_20295 [Salmonella enterica subsp. enterica]|nr:hypothetical protein [Salmonella enterica subsp. enterica]EDV1533702.1 hypothetical protein [Salmonella enterica subsp. enterica]